MSKLKALAKVVEDSDTFRITFAPWGNTDPAEQVVAKVTLVVDGDFTKAHVDVELVELGE